MNFIIIILINQFLAEVQVNTNFHKIGFIFADDLAELKHS